MAMNVVESQFKYQYARGVLKELHNWRRNRQNKGLPTEALTDAIEIITEYRDIMLDMPAKGGIL